MTKEEAVAKYQFLNPNGVMIEKVKYNEQIGKIIVPKEVQEQRTSASPMGTILKVSEFKCEDEERQFKKDQLKSGMKIHFANAAQTIPGGFENYPNIQIIHIDDVVGVFNE